MVIGPCSLDSCPLDAPDALGTYGGHDTPRRFRDAEIRQMDEWIDGCSRYLDMIPRYVHLIVPEVLFFFLFRMQRDRAAGNMEIMGMHHRTNHSGK
jgi:hypothetical protein